MLMLVKSNVNVVDINISHCLCPPHEGPITSVPRLSLPYLCLSSPALLSLVVCCKVTLLEFSIVSCHLDMVRIEVVLVTRITMHMTCYSDWEEKSTTCNERPNGIFAPLKGTVGRGRDFVK